jgi:hypothetical protein
MSVNPILGEEKMSELATEFWPVQPEPGSVADQLIKKGEARGEKRGEKRGEARGQAREKRNTIRILQSILSIPQSTDTELSDKKLEELQVTIEQLQQMIMNQPR